MLSSKQTMEWLKRISRLANLVNFSILKRDSIAINFHEWNGTKQMELKIFSLKNSPLRVLRWRHHSADPFASCKKMFYLAVMWKQKNRGWHDNFTYTSAYVFRFRRKKFWHFPVRKGKTSAKFQKDIKWFWEFIDAACYCILINGKSACGFNWIVDLWFCWACGMRRQVGAKFFSVFLKD